MKTLRLTIKERIAVAFVLAFSAAIITSTAVKTYLPLAYAAINTNNYPMTVATALRVDLDIISGDELREIRMKTTTLNTTI
ncbi:TPA: hypothetical protein N0H21_001288 [Pseudomonas aeruginosa]|uniref:hypothetical protein n=1 Tax=Pseudomonas aeruginosa TaxID=287 RepID=UPI0031B7EA17|nr:hypothetical protein [Pseudomonas aeruginosa]